MYKRILMATAVAGSLAFSSAPATAQQAGLINVDIGPILSNNRTRDVLSNILNRNNIDIADVAANVNVPIGLAANICGTTVALLSAAASGGTCTASTDISQGHLTALANTIQKNR